MPYQNRALAKESPVGETRDHLFISYAWEDRALASWLTLKLTAEGYRVWCDRFRMLGGESFPRDIDHAIKSRTFRLIALLSHNSINKQNPTRERTLALSIGQERSIDLLIPLNVDGLKPTELNWMLSALTYIPFTNWASGLHQLLRKLAAINTPRVIVPEGRSIAAEMYHPRDIVLEKRETLFTNCLRFREVPRHVWLFDASREIDEGERDALSEVWPYYIVNERQFLSFYSPPSIANLDLVRCKSPITWWESVRFEGIMSRNIVSSLLRQSFICSLLARGLKKERGTGLVYFPTGLGKRGKIHYKNDKDRLVPISTTGTRKFGSGRYRYHLAPVMYVRQDLGDDFMALMHVRLLITDLDGNPMLPAQAFARRKHLTKNWHNHQWLTRQLSVIRFLSNGLDKIVLGGDGEKIVLDSVLLHGDVPVSVNERLLARRRKEIPAMIEPDDED